MSLMYDAESELNRVTRIRDDEYNVYRDEATMLREKYNELRDKYNNELSIINNERVSMRKEIKSLYVFLKSISNNIGSQIKIFDFAPECSPLNSDKPLIEKIEKPAIEKGYGLLDSLVKNLMIDKHNKEIIENYETEIERQKTEKLDKDLADRHKINDFLEDAVQIAEIYRNIVILVRDAIRDKIIPEMSLIKAFLYADAIRERVIDEESIETVVPNNIDEYEGTKQDIHFQFVKNTYDFYNISINFFKRMILYDIIKDQKITGEEKEDFNQQKNIIENSLKLVEEKKVLHNGN